MNKFILNNFKIDTYIGMLGVCFVKKQIFGILLVLFLFFVIIKGQDLIIVFDFFSIRRHQFQFVCLQFRCVLYFSRLTEKKLWKVSFFSQNIVSDFLMKCPCGFRQAVCHQGQQAHLFFSNAPAQLRRGRWAVHLLSCDTHQE